MKILKTNGPKIETWDTPLYIFPVTFQQFQSFVSVYTDNLQ